MTGQRLTAALLVALTIWAGSQAGTTARAAGSENVTYQMGWWHEQTYAGFYAAEREGRYGAAGLKVAFIEGGSGINPLARLSNGKAHFATSTASAVLNARAKGSPIVAFACFYRRSPLAFAAKPGSGIRHPRDLAGKTVRVAEHNLPILRAMTAHIGLTDDAYQVVHGRDIKQFHGGKVDVWGGYLPEAILKIRKVTPDLVIIHPDNFGIHTYHNCLTTTETMIEKKPASVRRFLAASIWGWRYVAANPSRVGALVSAFNAKADSAGEIEKFLLALPLIDTGEDTIGWMKPEIWSGSAKTFLATSGSASDEVAREAYTLRFLKEVGRADGQ